MNKPKDNRFGITLRALRLGYHLSSAHKCWIRMRPSVSGTVIECVPEDQLIKDGAFNRPEESYRWDEGQEILDMVSMLRSMKQQPPRKPVAFVVGEQGQLIRELP